MEKTFLDYYRANLHYIRSSAKDFAAEFPKIASRLEISAFDCEDPYIERLLEGTAFLAAKVDERISRGFPRMLESVVSAISPKSLFPNPSFGVVACNFDSGKFSSSGIEIKSNEIMEVDVAFTSTKCKFSPCWSVNFAPIKIKDVKYDRKKAIVPTFNVKQPFSVVDDVTSPYQYDFLITVVDKAKITKDKDGAVVGGNKIKIGLPITLEGADYKLNGIVSNITVVAQSDETNSEEIDKQVNQNQDVQ